MALTPSVVTAIASALAMAKLIVKDSVENIIDTLQNVSLEYIHNTTTIDIETLQTFMNQTLPCLYNVSEKYGDNPNISDYDMMWVECFHYQVPIPKPPIPCDEDGLSAFVNLTMFTLSTILLIIMTCCVQRRHRSCLRCCRGFPGPVVPLNMLDSYENRKGYMLSFGITITAIVSIFLGENRSLLGNFDTAISEASRSKPYISIFVKILLAIYVAVMNYPLFIAQNIHNKLIGSLLGIFLCVVWLGLEAFKVYVYGTTCFKKYERDNVERLAIIVILFDVPKYIFLLLLMGKFVYVLVKTAKQRADKKKKGLKVDWLHEDDTDWRDGFIYVHVKNVLKKRLQKPVKAISVEDLSFKDKIIANVRARLYEIKPGFQYSTRMVISTFVAVMAIYMLMLIIIMVGYLVFDTVWDLIFNNDLVAVISEATGISLQTLKDYLNCVQVSFWIGLVLSIMFYALVAMNSLTWYRRHVMRLRAGDRSFLPNSVKNNSLGAGPLMVASFKFAGFQVAYASWGFLLTFVIFVIATYVVATQLFLPMIRNELSILLILILKIWPNILIAIVMTIAQMLISKCCFLHDGDTLAVDNRRAYHILSYFLFYFNILLGLVSCLIRILFGMAFGVIFLQRLSKSTLPRSYERRDPGYLAYLGFLMMEHQHSNPVLQCFVRLLLETQGMELKDEFFSNPQGNKTAIMSLMTISVNDDERSKAKAERVRRARIRNRWHLFTMLSLNPSILKYRIRFVTDVNKEKKFLMSRLAFGFNNNCFDEEYIVKKPLPEDDGIIDCSHDEKQGIKEIEEQITNDIPTTTKDEHDLNNEKTCKDSPIFGNQKETNSSIKGIINESEENDIRSTRRDTADDTENDDTVVDVDFRDNNLNIVDTNESTPILMRRFSSQQHV